MSDIVAYDCEATDADQRHGQVTQFGAVRADMSFNVLAETDLRIRRLPWVVPAAKALEVTRMSPWDLSGEGYLSEYRASGEIERFLSPGYGVPRVMLTFNGIRFDDELLRTTLFRNLRYPWFSSGKLTTKVDLLPLVRLVHASNPEAINVAEGEGGKLSWRLESLAPANGIAIDAHDGLSDAKATLDLGRLVSRRAPWEWEVAMACGRPSKVESLLADAKAAGRPVYLFTHFAEADVAPCAVLGTDGRKKWILADLRQELDATDMEAISGSMFTRGTPFPVIKSNASPIFIDAANAARLSPALDTSRIAARAMEIKIAKSLGEAATEALKGREYDEREAPTSEELIYSGFVADSDRPSMTAFHRASDWRARAAIAFADPRLRDFAARIVVEACRNGEHSMAPEALSEMESRCAEALSRPWAGEGARWATLASELAANPGKEYEDWAQAAFASKPDAEAREGRGPAARTDEGPAQMDLGF